MFGPGGWGHSHQSLERTDTPHRPSKGRCSFLHHNLQLDDVELDAEFSSRGKHADSLRRESQLSRFGCHVEARSG